MRDLSKRALLATNRESQNSKPDCQIVDTGSRTGDGPSPRHDCTEAEEDVRQSKSASACIPIDKDNSDVEDGGRWRRVE